MGWLQSSELELQLQIWVKSNICKSQISFLLFTNFGDKKNYFKKKIRKNGIKYTGIDCHPRELSSCKHAVNFFIFFLLPTKRKSDYHFNSEFPPHLEESPKCQANRGRRCKNRAKNLLKYRIERLLFPPRVERHCENLLWCIFFKRKLCKKRCRFCS